MMMMLLKHIADRYRYLFNEKHMQEEFKYFEDEKEDEINREFSEKVNFRKMLEDLN